MRAPGEITFLCLVMFFVVSMDPKDPIKWHTAANALATLTCGILSIITKLNGIRRKHLISGKSGSLMDVI
jgi:hypothetical protein